MHVSPKGRKMIEGFEGCRLGTYLDIVGVPTIGYGCTGPDVRPGMSITQEQADQMLSDRLTKEFEPALNKHVGNCTTQGQFDAMACLAFNIGVGGFLRSHVLSHHVAKEWQDAADAFAMWNKAGGRVVEALERRRDAEAQLYIDSSPDDMATAPAPAPVPADTGGDLGHQKAIAALVVPPAVGLGSSMAAAHGFDVTPHLPDIIALMSGLFVWLTPHGRGG